MTLHKIRWPGILMAFSSAICYSTLTIFVKLAYSYHLNVTTIVALRMVFASVFLWLTLLLVPIFLKKKFNGKSGNRWRISRRHWLMFFGGVVLAFGGSQITYFTGLQTIPAGVAIFLVYTYPVLVIFLAFLLYGERPSLQKIGVALICFLGCGFLSWEPLQIGQLGISAVGILWILAAALAIALYTTYSQRLLQNYSPLVLSAWMMPPIGLVFLLLDWNNLPRYLDLPLPAWLVLLATGFLATYVSLLLYLGAIGRIGAAHAALICTIEPVSTAMMAALILSERFTFWQMFGAALILAGLLVLEWRRV
jgi:drug/metabolite transporter (DMT)-like permease